MAQQNLRSVITIAGNVDGSFHGVAGQLSRLGDQLYVMGSYVDQLGQKIRDLGMESLTDYANFDDVMLKIQSVSEMSEKELAIVEACAREMGKTTRYTAQDAAEASLILAQVGLGYQEIVDLLPDVLRLAQAGDMSIASSADYLYSSLKSMGYGLDYADTLIDQMAKTASIGATDVDTLGQSMTRIGSSLSLFKGGSTEVLAILSAMSEYGEDMRGTTGGTALRNFMLSLAAPSGNREATVALLENVGASMEELDEIMEDVDLRSAAKAIEDMGLEVYDKETGKLRGAIDIITSLRDSVSGLNDEAKYNALAQIFGKRTLTTAMNLIQLTDEEWNKLMEDIRNSAGYADFMAETQESGLGGSIRLLKSQWEEFKLSLGEAIAPQAQEIMQSIGDILTGFSEMDEGKMQTLVNVLAGIAITGPGLMAVGGALKFLAFLLSPAGWIAAGVVGLSALAFYLHQISEENFRDTFGDMALDMEALTPFVDSLGQSFRDSYTDIDKFEEAVHLAVENYETAATKLSRDALTASITGKKLTQDEITALMGLGDDMAKAVEEGILEANAMSLSVLDLIHFNGEGEDNSVYTGMVDTQNAYYASLRADAVSIGADLRAAMTEALRDEVLDANEYEAIAATAARYNAVMAAIDDVQNAQARERMMLKAQTLSWDGFETFAQEVIDQAASADADMQEKYEWAYAEQKVGLDMREQAAWKLTDPAEREAELAEVERLRATALPDTTKYYDEQRALLKGQAGAPIMAAFHAMMAGNEYGEGYSLMQRIFADQVRASGGDVNGVDFSGLNYDEYFAGMSAEQARAIQTQINNLAGDSGELTKYLEPFAGKLPEIDTILSFFEAVGEIPTAIGRTVDTLETVEQQQIEWDMTNAMYSGDPSAVFDVPVAPHVPVETYGQTYWDEMTNFFRETPVPVPIETSDPALDGAAYKEPFEAAAAPELEVTTDDPYASGMQYGSTWAAGASQTAVFNATAQVSYTGGGSGGRRSGGNTGGGKQGGGFLNKFFAEGGRANEASIFGEAGPEWAIPEEHTGRTADLLDAARAASGFTWPELLARTGGLNAGTAPAPVTLIYSPTIQAADAAGVRAELLADKERLERWLSEKQLLERRMSYA